LDRGEETSVGLEPRSPLVGAGFSHRVRKWERCEGPFKGPAHVTSRLPFVRNIIEGCLIKCYRRRGQGSEIRCVCCGNRPLHSFCLSPHGFSRLASIRLSARSPTSTPSRTPQGRVLGAQQCEDVDLSLDVTALIMHLPRDLHVLVHVDGIPAPHAHAPQWCPRVRELRSASASSCAILRALRS